MTLSVLVVEDHPVFRDGLAFLVRSQPELALAGAVSTAEDAISVVAQRPVDVVLMDLNLPGISGIEATRLITARPDAPAVIVLTMVDEPDTVVSAIEAGARGYVLKGAEGADIVTALLTVGRGGATFGAGVAGTVLSRSTASPPAETDARWLALTARERDIFGRLAEGQDNARIARSLDLSVKTVQNNVSRILDKLGVTDRTQAALLARSILPPD